MSDAAIPFAWKEVRWIEASATSDAVLNLRDALLAAEGPAPGPALRPWLSHAFMRSGADDATILEFALKIEQLGAAFYPEAERLGASAQARRVAGLLGAHEQTHVDQLFDVLGLAGSGRRPQHGFSFRWTGARGFLSIAVAIEALSAATYEVARTFLVQAEARLVARRLEILEAHHELLVEKLVEVEQEPDGPPCRQNVGLAFRTARPQRSLVREIQSIGEK
ncbi:MAG: ferritin-like domain-containing protein [Actinomycetota bacterium]|nr:ferritin-like domain-containing protein [Actinomycetota bacterium]